MANYKLAHPLYLDVQMMISFLAYIDGGVSLESESTVKSEQTKDRKASAAGKFRFPTISAILGLEASMSGDVNARTGSTTETKEARHHTAASLFNALYEYLDADEMITRVSHRDDLASVAPGQLVEVSGRYAGNPLEQILALVGQWMNYLPAEESEENPQRPQSGNRPNRSRRQSGQTQAADPVALALAQQQAQAAEELRITRQMVTQMLADMEASSVHDVLLKTPAGVSAVLTVSSEYYSPKINEYLTAGDFVALGKVTRVLRGDEIINLARRSVMGAAGSQTIEEIISSVATGPEMHVDAASPTVGAPAVQLLPMAIFV